MVVVMNSTIWLRVFWFVQGREVERVTKHPPGRTNFANGRDVDVDDDVDDDVVVVVLAPLFNCIFVSSTINPSWSETSSATNRSSSRLFRTKQANEVTGATTGDVFLFVFVFVFVFVVSDTVSNSRSSSIDPPPLALPLTLLLPLPLFGIIVMFGRTRIVSEQLLFELWLLVVDDNDDNGANDDATRENARRPTVVAFLFVFVFAVIDCSLMLPVLILLSMESSDRNLRGRTANNSS